jgi:hypothetical protein
LDEPIRKEAAQQAGLSNRQTVTAMRVANIPTNSLEQQVESDKPPTVTRLSEQGKKPVNGKPIYEQLGMTKKAFQAPSPPGNQRSQRLATRLPWAHNLRPERTTFMNPRAPEIMREALQRISAIHQPTKAPAEKYDLEELLEKLDFAVVTARGALDRAAIPGESLN